MPVLQTSYDSTQAARLAARILSRAKAAGQASILIMEFPNNWDKQTAESQLAALLREQGDRLFTLDVAEADEDFFAILHSLGNDQVGNIVGLPDGQPELLIRLNWRREFFIEECKRVVFWLTHDAVKECMQVAPDFWAFQNRHIIIAPTPRSEGMGFSSFMEDFQAPLFNASGFSHLNSDAKRERIAALESLLTNASDTARTRNFQYDLANLYEETGNTQGAIKLFEKLKAYYEQAAADQHKQAGESKVIEKLLLVYSALADVYANAGDIATSIEHYQQAIPFTQQLSNRPAEVVFLSALGELYRISGDVQLAIEYHEKALAISREVHYRAGEGNCLRNLGNAYRDLGEVRRAIDYYEQALAIAQEIGNRQHEKIWRNNLELVYRALAEVHLGIVKPVPKPSRADTEQDVLSRLEDTYLEFKEVHLAISDATQALEVARDNHDLADQIQALDTLGKAHYKLGQLSQAVDFFEQARTAAQKLDDRRSEGAICSSLGDSHYKLGQARQAIEPYQLALAVALETGDRHSEGRLLGKLSMAYSLVREEMKRLPCLVLAVVILTELDSPDAGFYGKQLAQRRAERSGFDGLLRSFFPDEDETLNEATGQHYTFFRDAPADMSGRILELIDSYQTD